MTLKKFVKWYLGVQPLEALMFTIMSKLQSFFNYCRWTLGVPHKYIDPIVQRLPFEKYLA